MNGALRPVLAPFGWSVALHALLLGVLVAGLALPRREPPLPVLPIEAVVVDQAVLQAAARQRRDDERQRASEAAERRQREEAEERERQQEAARLERIEAERRAEQAAKLNAEKEAEARRRTEAEAQRKADQQAQAKAAAERKAKADEARLRAEREEELRQRLADEEQRTSAAFQGLKARYIAAIQAHVERRWFRPPGIRAGTSCTVQLTQIPGGEVVDIRFGACEGGQALRQSIETAVRKASPLPPPPAPALFEREVRLVFRPED